MSRNVRWTILPLRVPVDVDLDLQGPFSDWLDWCEHHPIQEDEDDYNADDDDDDDDQKPVASTAASLKDDSDDNHGDDDDSEDSNNAYSREQDDGEDDDGEDDDQKPPPHRIPPDHRRRRHHQRDSKNNKRKHKTRKNNNNTKNSSRSSRRPKRRPQITAAECQDDLHRLTRLRHQVASILQQESYNTALEGLPVLQEYAAALQEFENMGFVLVDYESTFSSNIIGGDSDSNSGDNHNATSTDNNTNTNNTTTNGGAIAAALGVMVVPDDNSDEDAVPHQLADGDIQAAASMLPPVLFRWRTATRTGRKRSQNQQQQQDSNNNDGDDDDDSNSFYYFDSYGSLAWERANVIWNIITLEAYKAANTHPSNKKTWMAAGVHFAFAAATVRYLRLQLYPAAAAAAAAAAAKSAGTATTTTTPEQQTQTKTLTMTPVISIKSPFFAGLALQHDTLQIWESLLLAQAQLAGYHVFAAGARPRHFLLAKVAAAAVPLFQQAEDLLQDYEVAMQKHVLLLQDDSAFAATTTTRTPDPASSSATTTALVDVVLKQRLDEWVDVVRAGGMWMSAMVEYHQAVVHREKHTLEDRGIEVARLEGALRFGRLCEDYCESSSTVDVLGEEFALEIEIYLRKMKDRLELIESEHIVGLIVPDREDLAEIPMQPSVKTDLDISKILPAVSRPFFTNVMDPLARYYSQLFRSEMEKTVFQTAKLGHDKTESARKALALVNLPHSLTAYRQEQKGGGIPNELWERIRQVQYDERDDRLKRELWELRDLAESARATFDAIDRQLEEDLQMDSLFREQHGDFEGHDVQEIQRTFRQTMKNYDRLMLSAEESDNLLTQRSEILDNDPKFQLLKFQKSQLDRLLPCRGSGPEIDVSALSKHLVELSELFNDRESLIHTVQESVKTYNIAAPLLEVPAEEPTAEQEYQRILEAAVLSFSDMIEEMHSSIKQQDKLLDAILKENEDFMRARDVSSRSHTSSEDFIVKIEDALEELDQFAEHLKEGRAFYDVIIPKLRKLKEPVGVVSARLTSERCDFEDRLTMSRQEADDARIAANLLHNSRVPARRSEDDREDAHPGAESINRDGLPEVRVDDSKVASLVEMGMDADQVVAALKKYDNNVERALNDLLSG